ncbi:MAG TPA: DsbA family protein [Acidimicrobiia bacterium]|nr:DsbA family protein [Acidimicrobiia bacterium]
MSQLEIFAEIVCPFTHVSLRRLIDARDGSGANVPVRVRAWPLELVNSRPQDPDVVAREIDALRVEIAPELFKGFEPSRLPRTSIPAFGLAAAAYEGHGHAKGEAVSLALRDAVFEDGLDVGEPEVIAMLAERFGIEPPPSGYADLSARADWHRGMERHVQGSPHFFLGSRDWFCPGLTIRHQGGDYDIRVDETRRREFYASAFG